RFACRRSIRRSRNRSSGAGRGASSFVRKKNVPGTAATGADGVTALAFLRSPLAITTCEANFRELVRRVAQPNARLLSLAKRISTSPPFLTTRFVAGGMFDEGIAAKNSLRLKVRCNVTEAAHLPRFNR